MRSSPASLRSPSRLLALVSLSLFTLAACGGSIAQRPSTAMAPSQRDVGPVKAAPPQPPVAPRHAHADTLFGRVLVDPYHWMKERGSPEVMDYLEAENAYTDAMMAHTQDLQDSLYAEFVSRTEETDLSVPERLDDYYYYYRQEEGKEYRIYCRKKGSLDAPEQVLLDVNALAEGKDFMDVGTYQVSPDHALLLYGTDEVGNERYTLHVKDLAGGRVYDDTIENTTGNAVWANDDRTFFYTVPDEAWRPYRLYRHRLGEDPAQDRLVFEEPDEMFWMDIHRTKDEAYIILNLGSITTNEAWFLDADDPMSDFTVIQPRRHELEYTVYHHDNRFFILNNGDGAVNFKLDVVPVTSPGKAHWQPFVPYDSKVKLDGADVFADHLVLYERENGLQTIHVRRFSTGREYAVDFPEPVYSYQGAENPEYDTTTLRFTYMSLVTPDAVYDYDMTTRERTLMKQKKVGGDYHPGRYVSERLFAPAEDGTLVPISLVYRKGLKRDGSNPLLLYGYGAYGLSMDPWFSVSRISLLDRGFVYAIAHVRGGGEMGRPWYENGKLYHKPSTFTDFIACARYLVAQGYSRPERMVCEGGSAGGLLIGAVLNMAPDLFHVALAEVPFVDIVNTMLDESIPLTTVEYEEWGDPRQEDFFKLMLSYSPYDNVGAHEYPDLLVLAGLNDTRVQYWEPAKWTAELRARKTGNSLLLLRTEMESGHRGVSGRYQRLHEIAFEYAFALDRLGITS